MIRNPRLDVLLTIVFLAAIPALAVALQKPPAVVAATAPLTEFSAIRAKVYVERIAQRPHPSDSPESAKVRAYLFGEMTRLGLKPELITTEKNPSKTLIGMLPGKVKTRQALMLSAHYDSMPEAPGAGDDAAGVAAILETVRALEAGPPLENDLVILFTDGEEAGLNGANAYSATRRENRHVSLVLNFEARGSRGPSTMFETSSNNGWMIRQFAQAAPFPMASSLTDAVYQEMPNRTDLTVFKNTGIDGMNFAFIDGYENYHQPTDTVENLDLRSLQHHGSYALALARRFGNLDLTLADSEADATYFSVLGPHLIVYPMRFAIPLMVASMVGYGIVMMLGLMKKRLTEREVIHGAFVGLLAVVLATITTYGIWRAIAWGRPLGAKGQGTPEIAVGLLILGLIVPILTYGILRRKRNRAALVMGGMFVWLVLTVYMTLRLPGGSYLFVWPMLFGLIAMAVSLLSKHEDGPVARGAFAIGALPALILWPPTLQSLCAALGPSAPFVPAAIASLLILVLVPLVLGLFGRPISRETQPPHASA